MRVEVVTAVHSSYARYLPAAWRSLCAQTHQDWRWLIQVDDESPASVLAALGDCGAADDPRISLAVNGSHESPAITRNVALGRATAPLIQNLDADDELAPTALAALSAALLAHPTAGFAVGPTQDLLSSGELVEFPLPFEPGLLPRGVLVRAWSADHRLPVHPAGVMWRRELLLITGGWAAMRGMEDTGLLISASAIAPGVVVDTITLRYRKHRQQLSSRTIFFEGQGDQIPLIEQRAETLLARPGW
ncbi:glycosyltransferase family A protein [Nocardia vinacea]|uniref:glycosyltransferase family A protein n=1 Tax=Nocardia vinacea TaxID=96468 RepID=UPI0002F5FA5C|nr:glycosyltransferase family A protein [Nocardia vinacea]